MRLLSARTRRVAKSRGVDYAFLFMQANGDQLREIARLFDAGVIRPVIDRVFPFDANFLEPDTKLEADRNARVAVSQKVKEVMETAEAPGMVAEVVLKAAGAANPKLRYTAGVLAGRLRLLRTYAPAGLMDTGIRKDLRLDTYPTR